MRVISSYAAGAGVIIMKDIVDEMLDNIDQRPATGDFMPIPDIGNEPSETVGTKLAKVLRRTTLSPDAVLTVDEVIETVGGRAPVVRAWLKESVLPLRHPTGRVIFRWGDVLDAMRRAA